MSKVITFSTKFPKHHRKAGQRTDFEVNVPNGIKKTTIRAGKRWKVGDKFSPRIWSGLPYRSPQITLCPDFEVKRVYDIQVAIEDNRHVFNFMGKTYPFWEEHEIIRQIAKNDGLELYDLYSWFSKTTDCQIICWTDDVNYI